jgi:carboxylesterase
MQNSSLHNSHLDGSPFYMEGGSIGVLLIHGFTATPVEVRSLAKNLHEKGFTVAAPLLAGHGTTSDNLNHIRWADWVESAEKVYQKLTTNCEKVFVGGESLGGVLSLILASKYPEIAGVLLFAPAIKLTLNAFDKIKIHIGSLFISEVARSSMDSANDWQGYPGLPLKGAIQLLRIQAAAIKCLPLIKQPLLIFQGRKDTTVHPSAGDLIFQGVNSTIKEHHWMEQSSHAITIDCELAEVTLKCLNFMEKILKPI